MSIQRILLLFAISILGCVSAFAQATGQVVGTVEDSTGAVVPGATVKVVNDLTGIDTTMQSDEAGRFNFPRLPVGEYHVEATTEGFRRFVSESFRLNADQSRRVAVALEIGQSTETITVSGTVSQVETVGGTIKEVIDERRITELPLNGRNPVQLILLVPGVVPGPGSSSLNQNDALAVNGARAISNNYMLDGGDNNDPQQNVAAIMPNPDALEEFSVLTNNFSAEYGRNMGAIVNAITKSGTNQFHGSLYEFVRNDAFDARNFFALEKGKLRRNQFGGTVGGPIFRNRTFFFGSYEGVRQRRASTFSGLVVPTVAERAGDFSASARKPNDPLTGRPFPNNQIPRDRFDPASLNMMNELVPLPNAPNGRHIFNSPNNLNSDQYMGRLDHQFSDRHRLTGRVLQQSSDELITGGLPRLQAQAPFDNWNAMGMHTWTISPTLLSTAQFTYNQTKIDRGPIPTIGESGQEVSYQSLGVNVVPGAPKDQIELVPHFRGQVNGFWNLNQDNLVLIDRETWQGRWDLAYTTGAHMMKMGAEYRYSSSYRITANLVDPQFNFTGAITTNAFADFLIGRPANFRQGSLRINDIRNHAPAFYFQDDWKVLPDLTFSLGVRWEPFLPFFSGDDELTVFRPSLQQSQVFPNAPPGLLYVGDPGIPRGGSETDWNNIAPRFSLAWSPFGSRTTSIRAAYGIFYDTPRFHTLSQFVQSPPYSQQVQVNGPQSFSNPYGGRVNPFPYTPPATEQERQNYEFLLPVLVGLSIDQNLVAAYNQQWNFNIQQQLAKDFVFTAAYVGSKATHLPLDRELNPAIYRPGATLGNIDSRRLYNNFQSIVSYEPTAFSSYHAAQFSVNKRFSNGYTVLAHYTYGKAIDVASTDDAALQNPLNIAADKGLADTDVRHRFVTSFLWELPSPFQGGIGRAILGGWQTNGIFTATSGRPFTVTTGQDIALSGTGRQRPNIVGDPQVCGDCSKQEMIQGYFNPAAFANPAPGQFGNVGRNTLIGPGSWNLDAALFKGFQFTERTELTFRWELFNAFNHANLLNPRSNINAARPGQIDSVTDARVMQFGLRLQF